MKRYFHQLPASETCALRRFLSAFLVLSAAMVSHADASPVKDAYQIGSSPRSAPSDDQTLPVAASRAQSGPLAELSALSVVPRGIEQWFLAHAANDLQRLDALVSDDVQLIYGAQCPASEPCLGRSAVLAASPPAGELQWLPGARVVAHGNVWRAPLRIHRDGKSATASLEAYVRGERIASLVIALNEAAPENRAARGSASFNWEGIEAQTAADLDIASSKSRARLIKILRGGGVVVHCRHGNTDWAEQDVFGRNYSALQRQEQNAQRKLSELGRAEGRAIHRAFKVLEVQVSAAYSTWWSRTREFGALVAGFAPTETEAHGGGTTVSGSRFQGLLREAAKRPGVTLLAGHNQPLTSMNVLHGAPFREGDCVILRATSETRFEILAHLVPGQWAQLARP